MTEQPQQPQSQLKDPPAEADKFVQEWQNRVSAARKHWDKFYQRVAHNRKLVAGFDWTKDPKEANFYQHRANLIHGTITAILPNIYARNPEMAVTPQHAGRDLKLLCKTIQQVTNRQLEDAKLKKRAKAAVRAALTCSFGAVKVMYQRDLKSDPHIKARIQDTQDNIARIETLLAQVEDPEQRRDHEAARAELAETLAALEEQAEVVAAEGLVIDRVLTDHIVLDDSLAEFEDYVESDWMAQLIPMKKSIAEGVYGFKLDGAKTYKPASATAGRDSRRLASGEQGAKGDEQICIIEIWDKQSQRVYTVAEGLNFWLKAPFSPPKVGERWYPFFLLPFQMVDGTVIGPSLVDLTERLQAEHNELRDKEKAHRDMIQPGYVAGAEVSEKSIKRYKDSVLGEITIIDTEGKPLNQVIAPKQHPPLDPMVYDTSKVRYDWEQVSGMQDAARSSVVQPKTATEASIMQQSLSGRVSEFRDQVEDWLQEISQYAAQIELQELTEAQVERIMGPHKEGPIPGPDGNPLVDPMTGQELIGPVERAYDWPQLSKDEIFDLVQLKIRAGTTGEPDKIEQQEVWIKMMPVVQPLITQIMQMQMQGIDTTALESLLRETVARFDDKLDVDQIVPKLKALPPPAAPGMPGAPNLQAVA